jgi:hypothetical protein
MFERYTERARRVIFFARYDASNYGSSTIESEHLLLGLLREDRNLIQRLIPDVIDNFKEKIEQQIKPRPRIATSINLPLSLECKQILAYADEETQTLGHSYLSTEHLLLGILREAGSIAAQLLRACAVELDPLRKEVAKSVTETKADPTPAFRPPPPADRASVHALVDKYPEERLGGLKMLMESILRAEGTPASHILGFADLFRQPATVEQDAEGSIRDGRTSSSRRSEGAVVVETHQFVHGHQISITEEFHLRDNARTLTYTHEVIGPKPEQRYTRAIDFGVSPSP